MAAGVKPPQPLTTVKDAAISFVNKFKGTDQVGVVSLRVQQVILSILFFQMNINLSSNQLIILLFQKLAHNIQILQMDLRNLTINFFLRIKPNLQIVQLFF